MGARRGLPPAARASAASAARGVAGLAALVLVLAGCGASGREAPAGAARPEAAPASLELPAEVAERVGTLGVPGGSFAGTVDTADAADTSDAADAPPVTTLPFAAPDGTLTVPLDLRCDGGLLAVRTPPTPEAEPVGAGPYTMGIVEPGGAFAPFGAPPASEADGVMQVDRASLGRTHAVWTQGPETDLYAFTWELMAADLASGEVRRLAGAADLLGVDSLPSFSLWSAPVVADGIVYHSSVLPADDGPLVDEEDGSRWTSGLVSVPLEGGEPRILVTGTRLVATDGTDVVHLADGALEPGVGDADARAWSIVAQSAGGDPATLASGTVPEGGAVTAVALSEDTLAWVVSRYEQEDAVLLAMDRDDGEVRAALLGDVLAAPSVSGSTVGWGNWSGNVDPREFVWDTAGGGLTVVGQNAGGSRVRLCGDVAAVTGTVQGVPGVPDGVLQEVVVPLAGLVARPGDGGA